jgi:acetoin utilization protein AcuB
MLNETPVSRVMTANPVVANKFHNFSQVMRVFTEFGIHHLPVVDAEGRAFGIITSNDIPRVFMQLQNREPKILLDVDAIDQAINLEDIMTPNPYTIKATETLHDALLTMNQKRILAIPVVDDDNKIIGVVSMKDITYFLLQKGEN